MKRALLCSAAFPALFLATVSPAAAQSPCGGVNFVGQLGATCLIEPAFASYAATSVGLAPGGAATDIFCLTGSATKTVRVQTIRIGGVATTAVSVPILITKHSTADSGGTAATGSALPAPYSLDSNNGAATATTTAYTAPPTINDSAPGYVDGGVLFLPLVAATGGANTMTLEYNERNFMQAPTIRGVAQQICVNLNTTTVSGGLVQINMKWTEQ